jgi:hypothetical protein
MILKFGFGRRELSAGRCMSALRGLFDSFSSCLIQACRAAGAAGRHAVHVRCHVSMFTLSLHGWLQVQGMSIDKIAGLIVGHVGSKVRLTLSGNGGGETWSVDLIRTAYDEDAPGSRLSDAQSDQDDSSTESATATPRSTRSNDDACATLNPSPPHLFHSAHSSRNFVYSRAFPRFRSICMHGCERIFAPGRRQMCKSNNGSLAREPASMPQELIKRAYIQAHCVVNSKIMGQIVVSRSMRK